MNRIATAVAAVALVLTVVRPLSARAQWRDQPDALVQIEMMKNFVEAMSRYLEVSEKWIGLIEDKDMATYLAVERLIEIHKEAGDHENALKEANVLLKALAQ